jgi:hypothetical protein
MSMTEAEWQATTDPVAMVRFIVETQGANRRKAGRRRLRLFGCAVCRQLWEQLTDPRSRQAVEVAERWADGAATTAEAAEASAQAWAALRAVGERRLAGGAQYREAIRARGWLDEDERVAAEAAEAVLSVASGSWTWPGLSGSYPENAPGYAIFQRRRCGLADALRCLFGNPFRPVKLERAWRTSTVKSLAQGIYDERAFDRLPILADALEDAGCTQVDLLHHCRQSGEHVRGCWPLDLVLGRT